MMVKLILSFITAIATILCTFVFVTEVNASPYGAGKYNANVGYGGSTYLEISTSGNVAISVVPSDSGTVASATGNVTIVSTDVVGYKLYVRNVTSTNLTNGATTIPASANGSPAVLAVNTWGYNVDGSSNYVGMTLTDVLIRTGTGPSTGGDLTAVKYGVNVNNAKRSGAYSTSVIYTAVPQTN